MKKALIDSRNNRLCQVENTTFPVASDLQWIDCADDVTTATHDYDGSNFTKKPAPVTPITRVLNSEALSRALIKKGIITRQEVEAEY